MESIPIKVKVKEEEESIKPILEKEIQEKPEPVTPLPIKSFVLKSDKDKSYNVSLSITSDKLTIEIEPSEEISAEVFSGSFSEVEIKKLNKYFMICDNIKEIAAEITPLLTEQLTLVEGEDCLLFSVPIPSKKSPTCEFKIKKKMKEVKKQISDTVKIINDLSSENSQLKSAVEELRNKLNALSKTTQHLLLNADIREQFLDFFYPVGSFFLSSDSRDPAETFGGTWEKISDRFLVGAGNKYKLNSRGGEEEHVLTEAEMPNHNHVIEPYGGRFAWGGDFTKDGPASGNGWRSELSKHVTSKVGGGKAHNNMPPYLAVLIWKRIK